MKTAFVFFFGLLFVSQVFCYENPKKKVAVDGNDLEDEFFRDVTYPVSKSYPLGDYEVFTTNLLEKGDSCYVPSHMPSDNSQYTRLGCKLDLICMPKDIEACATSVFSDTDSDVVAEKCKGTCAEYEGENGVCNSDVGVQSCEAGLFCNMNADGMKSSGVCTKPFSLKEGSVSNNLNLCEYGLILAFAESSASMMYDKRTSTKCAVPADMQCNNTLTVAQKGCNCGNTDQTGYTYFGCFDSSLFSCQADEDKSGANECKFLGGACESAFKDYYAYLAKYQGFPARRADMDGVRSQAHLNHLASLSKSMFDCFDNLNYQNGNPADSLQGSAAALSLSLGLLISAVFLLL